MTHAGQFARESERADKTDLTTAHKLKDLILEAAGRRVRKIILFGSRARGDARADSDFDLLVVFRDLSPERKHAELFALCRALEGMPVAAEPWVMSEEEFEANRSRA